MSPGRPPPGRRRPPALLPPPQVLPLLRPERAEDRLQGRAPAVPLPVGARQDRAEPHHRGQREEAARAGECHQARPLPGAAALRHQRLGADGRGRRLATEWVGDGCGIQARVARAGQRRADWPRRRPGSPRRSLRCGPSGACRWAPCCSGWRPSRCSPRAWASARPARWRGRCCAGCCWSAGAGGGLPALVFLVLFGRAGAPAAGWRRCGTAGSPWRCRWRCSGSGRWRCCCWPPLFLADDGGLEAAMRRRRGGRRWPGSACRRRRCWWRSWCG